MADLSSRGASLDDRAGGQSHPSYGWQHIGAPRTARLPARGLLEKLKQVFAGDGLAAEEISGKLVLSW